VRRLYYHAHRRGSSIRPLSITFRMIMASYGSGVAETSQSTQNWWGSGWDLDEVQCPSHEFVSRVRGIVTLNYI
jgi:hypothetical protein